MHVCINSLLPYVRNSLNEIIFRSKLKTSVFGSTCGLYTDSRLQNALFSHPPSSAYHRGLSYTRLLTLPPVESPPHTKKICTSELCQEGYIKLQLYCIV